MLVGDLAGEKVSDAKPKLKATLVAAGDGLIYSEPERAVVSRSGDACVVALTDQWYLTYGEDEWAASARECLSGKKEKREIMFFIIFFRDREREKKKKQDLGARLLIQKNDYEKKNSFSSQHLRRRVPPRLRAHPGLAPPVGVLEVVRARDAAALGPQLLGEGEKCFFFFCTDFFPTLSFLLSLSPLLFFHSLTPHTHPKPTTRSSLFRTRRSTWPTTASRTCSRAETCTERGRARIPLLALNRRLCAPKSSPTRSGTLSFAAPRSPPPSAPTRRRGRPSGRRSASLSSGTRW